MNWSFIVFEFKNGAHELELSGDEFRALVNKAVDHISVHVDALSIRPASSPLPPVDVLSALREPLPESPIPFGKLLDQVFDDLLSSGLETAGPGYLAYMPSGGLLQAAIAELIVAAINRYTTVWAASPGLAELEATVIRWLADLIGFPVESRGFLASGGSMANFSAVLTARRYRLGDDLVGGTVYASDIVHHSMLKACMMAGFSSSAFREIESDSAFRLSPEIVRERIRADRHAGLRPFLLVGNAGATLTGSVDDLIALSDVAREEGLWFHVDAAYGGFFLLTERGRKLLAGMDRADSVTLDPHKALFMPYGTGALLVRDGNQLRNAHQSSGQRYSPRQEHSDRVDFCEYSPELSREFRGLRMWLPLKMHGAGPFRRNLDEKLDIAMWTAEQLRAIPGIEILFWPVLTIILFRWMQPSLNPEELDVRNKHFLDAINARRRVVLMGVTLRNRFFLRLCILSFRTHRKVLEHAIEDIRAEVTGILHSS